MNMGYGTGASPFSVGATTSPFAMGGGTSSPFGATSASVGYGGSITVTPSTGFGGPGMGGGSFMNPTGQSGASNPFFH
jgi:hypothetical protein